MNQDFELFKPLIEQAEELTHVMGGIEQDDNLLVARCNQCNQMAVLNIVTKQTFGGAISTKCLRKEIITNLGGNEELKVKNQNIEEYDDMAKKKAVAKKKTAKKGGIKKNGAVAKVQELCAKLHAKKGKEVTRKEMVEACIKAGLNAGTASVQVGKYRKEHKLVKASKK